MAASLDTLTLAAEERAKQGIHELEISFGGELDLHKHFNNCQKNPGHHKFIPIKKLGNSQIPAHLIPWVERMSGFTVKLSVNYVSPNRPPGYPLSDRAGQRVLSVGSGYVTDFPSVVNIVRLKCPFTNCGELPRNHEVCGYITVVTAAHVVFDDEEAKNTTVQFFYDDPDDRSGVMTARGVKVGASSVEGDFCELLCVTHDQRLFQWLNGLQRYMPDFTLKFSVNYVSPNRPPGYPLSARAGQRVLSVGSGYVTDFPSYDNIVRMKCPFTNCDELPGNHKVCGYITVVTAAHVVFDDEEAKNTTVEFFYDDPDDRSGVVTARGVKVGASSVEGDFCELLCVTHDDRLFQRFSNWWRIVQSKGRRICDLFTNILPALEDINLVAGTGSKFIVKISLNNPSQAVEALVVLRTFTENVLVSAIEHWDFRKTSFCEVLGSYSFKKHKLLTVIDFELRIGTLTDANKHTASFSHLRRTLIDLRETVNKTNTYSPPMTLGVFKSLVSEVAQYYSTVESLEKRLSVLFDDYYDKFNFSNRLEVVNISNGTATVEVSLLRTYEYFAILGYRAKCTELMPLSDDEEYEPDLNESKPDMLLVHIAHPHGQSKQVTIGRQTDCFTGDGFYHQLYTAPTCPGSSGGPVWMTPASGDLSQIYGVPHSGHHGNELNKECSWTIYPHKC